MGAHLNSTKRVLNRYGHWGYSLITETKTCTSTDPDDIVISETTDNFLCTERQYKNKEIDGTLIKTDDIRLSVCPDSLDSTPSTSDQITDGTDRYSIIQVTAWKDRGEVALYILQIRK